MSHNNLEGSNQQAPSSKASILQHLRGIENFVVLHFQIRAYQLKAIMQRMKTTTIMWRMAIEIKFHIWFHISVALASWVHYRILRSLWIFWLFMGIFFSWCGGDFMRVMFVKAQLKLGWIEETYNLLWIFFFCFWLKLENCTFFLMYVIHVFKFYDEVLQTKYSFK